MKRKGVMMGVVMVGGNAVGGGHHLRMFIQHPGEHLDVAQHHQSRQLAVLGALVFLHQRGCRDGEQQRDGGAEDKHAELLPEGFSRIDANFGRSDDINLSHNPMDNQSSLTGMSK